MFKLSKELGEHKKLNLKVVDEEIIEVYDLEGNLVDVCNIKTELVRYKEAKEYIEEYIEEHDLDDVIEADIIRNKLHEYHNFINQIGQANVVSFEEYLYNILG